MPDVPRPSYPGKIYRLGQAARDGMLVVVRCAYCRRQTRFLASDLVTLLDPRRDPRVTPEGRLSSTRPSPARNA